MNKGHDTLKREWKRICNWENLCLLFITSIKRLLYNTLSYLNFIILIIKANYYALYSNKKKGLGPTSTSRREAYSGPVPIELDSVNQVRRCRGPLTAENR